MALVFREKNMAKWIGVRPGHFGTKVVVHGIATNAAVTLYTVAAGYVLLVFTSSLDAFAGGAAAAFFVVRNADTTAESYLHRLAFGAAGTKCDSASRFVPYELVAGQYITLESNAAGCTARGQFEGVLVPV